MAGDPTVAGDENLRAALDSFMAELPAAHDDEALYALQVRYLGKKGTVTALRKQMGKLSPDERKAFGKAFNEVKSEIEGALEQRKQSLVAQAHARELARHEDLTMIPPRPAAGTLHPITQTKTALERVFRDLGFDVADGPHVEHELYNFDKLNIPKSHPARDMQDTFFVRPRDTRAEQGSGAGQGESHLVLRTHTSPVQIRTMLAQPPPIRIVAPGTVFRRDDDPTHSPMFHQIEGLYIDKGVTMADLKYTLYRFVSEFFGQSLEVRFRPSYFPFVEPGAEFDMQSPFEAGKWIELGGSGMVHPKVLRACGIDPTVYSGWAFGFGIDRMAMLRHEVPDLKLFFDGDQRTLEQFPC